MEPLLEGLLRSLGGSEANFLELCSGRRPYGNFHTKATSKKFRSPSGNFSLNPPELPRSPSMSFSSREAGWKIVLGAIWEIVFSLKRWDFAFAFGRPLRPWRSEHALDYILDKSRAAKRGGFKRVGFPIWTCPSFFVLFLSFLGLSRFIRDFPDLRGDGPGIFPICPFLFLGLLRAPTRNSPERVRDTIWTFPEKSGKHPGLETPRFSFSQTRRFASGKNFKKEHKSIFWVRISSDGGSLGVFDMKGWGVTSSVCASIEEKRFGGTSQDLVGACLATSDRIFATGSDSVSKIALRSCGCFCLIFGHTIMV